MKINLYIIFIVALLFVTRLGGILPKYIIHIVGVMRLPEIGLALGFFLYLIIKKKKTNVNVTIKYSFIILLMYIFLELIRTMIIYDQSFLLTLKEQKHLYYGIFIFLTPLIITNQQRLYNILKILLTFSTICGGLFIYQCITKRNLFNTWSILQDVGGVSFFRNLEGFPFILIFFSFGLIFYLLNKKDYTKKDLINFFLIIVSFIIVIISMTRTFWIAYIICLIIILCLSNKNKILKIFFVIFPLILLSYNFIMNKLGFLTVRFNSILNSILNNEGTFGYRIQLFLERFYLIKSNNLFLGLGLVNAQNKSFDSYLIAGGEYSNNVTINHTDIGYSGMIAQLGIFGSLLYLIFVFSCTIGIYNIFKKEQNLELKSITLGLFITCIWVLLTTFQNAGIYGDYLFSIILATGLAYSIKGFRLNQNNNGGLMQNETN